MSVLRREQECQWLKWRVELCVEGRIYWGPGPRPSYSTCLLMGGELGTEGLTASPWFFVAARYKCGLHSSGRAGPPILAR